MQEKMNLYQFRNQKSNKCLRPVKIYVLAILLCTFQSIAANPDISDISEIIKTEIKPDQSKKTVRGRIVDNTGEPVIGANIIEIGADNNGTVTDIDGNFSLIVEENAVLRISYIGFLVQDVNTAGRTSFNITLQEDTKALDEVVVVAYGESKRSTLTNAQTSISSEAFAAQPVTRLDQACPYSYSRCQFGEW